MIIGITNLCNLNCPWCIAKYDKRPHEKIKNKVIPTDAIDIIINHIQLHNDKKICLSGGEPLLFPDITKYFIEKLRLRFDNNIAIEVTTNGLLLTEDLVKFFNMYNVQLNMSFVLSGYKGLLNILHKCKSPSSIIKLVRNLKHKRFLVIINRQIPFSNEAILINQIYDCNVECTPDLLDIHNYIDNDFTFIQNELNKLKKMSNDLSWFTMINAGMEYCNCEHRNLVLTPDKNLIMCQPVYGPMYGCLPAQYRMGNNIYNQYCVLVDNFNYTK